MPPPIQADKAEELIMAYIKIRHQVIVGKLYKIERYLEAKAHELGFGIASAWRIVRWARRIGAIDSRPHYG